jgi:hypothetical protein
MSEKNMLIWDQVKTSDPDSIKEVSFGRKFSAINAHHQVREATKVFGPIGKGWGTTNDMFIMLMPGLLHYQADFWWKDDEGTHQFGISASIATNSNNGRLDDECTKKVATDALTKGLSKLGFNADIFLGMWDDNKYVNTVKEEKKKVETAAAKSETENKLKALEAEAKKVRAAAAVAAKEGLPDDVMGLWKDNPQLHNIKGFKAAIGKYGTTAKKNKEVKEAAAAETNQNQDEGQGEG